MKPRADPLDVADRLRLRPVQSCDQEAVRAAHRRMSEHDGFDFALGLDPAMTWRQYLQSWTTIGKAGTCRPVSSRRPFSWPSSMTKLWGERVSSTHSTRAFPAGRAHRLRRAATPPPTRLWSSHSSPQHSGRPRSRHRTNPPHLRCHRPGIDPDHRILRRHPRPRPARCDESEPAVLRYWIR
jgi:hypothetical protein